jgi:hypothetical protein
MLGLGRSILTFAAVARAGAFGTIQPNCLASEAFQRERRVLSFSPALP